MALALVGGAFLSSALNVIFDKLASPEFVNLIRGKKPDKFLQKMNNQLMVVRAVLNDAEKRQITDHYVKQWLDVLKDVVYQVDDLLDEVSTKAATQEKVSNSFSHFFNKKKIVSVSKLEEIVERLDDVLKQKENLDLKDIPLENETWRAQPTCLEDGYGVYGRDQDKEAIMKMSLEDNCNGEQVSVIPIVGMGGVGKTTLARSVYNDCNLKQVFDSKAWVCLSDKFDIVKLTKSMIEQVSQCSCGLNDLNSLQLDLMGKLKDKKFLIVLDDVWIENYDDWSNLTKPFLSGTMGSKILVTTRDENVASKFPFNVVQVYRLNKLSNEDCWLVFANHAFPPSESNENRRNLEEIGREIVEKCNGLPLAAQSLGGMLRRKIGIRDWENILKSDIWELPESQCKILPALRISYHYLPSSLKRCFVYSSLYPKDYEFKKNELTLLWMAEDLVTPPKKGKTLEEVSYEYFDDLVSRSFFLRSSNRTWGNYFVMHDLMHDLATSLGGQFYLRYEELGKETKADNINTRHLSFNKFSDPVSDIEFFGRVKLLRTFLPINFEVSPFNNEKAPCIIMSKLKYLRVLSFCDFSDMDALPDSVGELIHLRYLNLSHTRIETLPESICNLYNLHTLMLYRCGKLTKLPNGFQNLINLHHLDILDTSIKEMPRGMGKLNHLQHLDFFIVGNHKENGIKELGGLSNLQGSFSIINLENVTQSHEALEARIMDKKHVHCLSLGWSKCINICTNFEIELDLDVLCKLEPYRDLEGLSITSYKGARFPDWVGNFTFQKMKSLSLRDCNNCCVIPSLGQLPSLKELHISKLNSVRTIDASFYKNEDYCSGTPFPSLESLSITDMPCWEVWSSFDSEAFPRLKDLRIRDCPKLREELPNHLPALVTLTIINCKLLASSLPRSPSLRELEISGSNKVAVHELPCSVESIKVKGSPVVESMIEAITNIQPTSLQSLTLRDCSTAISFPDGHLPVSLKTLCIQDVRKLEFPTQHKHESLESLTIQSCDSLTSLPLVTFPNLRSIQISECENMESLSVSGSESFKSVSSFEIRKCPNFLSFPKGLFVPNLTRLEVSNCDKLKTFPDQMRTLLPKLQYLEIYNCPEIECFPGGGMPPNLTRLEIWNCEKLLSGLAWPSMDKLTSLYIQGPCDGIKSFPKEGLLPPSLTSLALAWFSRLETLECKGLSHLTSLQTLDIFGCEKLENIVGERLPMSLITFSIRGCPLLGKQCRKKHRQIWPKIWHIRGIKVDDRWI